MVFNQLARDTKIDSLKYIQPMTKSNQIFKTLIKSSLDFLSAPKLIGYSNLQLQYFREQE